MSDPYALHAIALAYGATREELARALEAKAHDVRAGASDYADMGVAGVILVREANSCGGEEALQAQMYMVFHTESDGPPIAIFRDRELAERLAAGKPLFDEGDGLGVDIGVSRIDLVGTWWNSIDPDPTEVGGR